ncbi:alpha-ketoacid dehydrogenase subunit beta [Thermoflavimicrobium dichotomicum]|uniref:Pyruvate dehydrogenase E1 component beta subunit n=1 Tax=Thermoflavimicrobium dichotomicum TaxID=46223 RepID=A0A1I3THG6_9BACL|nr:alpha-ketoacid dehydrogenase subunit beta [Thermoflavimicrobium dichotomicum]SFJ69972.1 pyruvate dehydrogenase E1 component beta subunit [Thermoflavimicrobium dichotomicum]
MEELNIVQSINQGIKQCMENDEDIVLFGQDVATNGGVFRVTDGLLAQFNESRVFDTPLSESGIVGIGIGMALNHLKPIIEIQFMGFLYPAFEQIVSHAARIRSRSKGKFSLPLLIRTPYGGGIGTPEIHSDSCEAFFVHQPGIKVVVPSNPYDAKGLIISAIQDPDPVLFLEPIKIYRSVKGKVPSEMYKVPLGRANIVKEGDDLSVFSWGAMLHVTEKAVEVAEKSYGISIEVVDLRTLSPLDTDTILTSVEKTGRCLVVHEAPKTCGLGAEIVSLVTENVFYFLKSPIERVTGFDIPYPPYAYEKYYLPDVKRIVASIKKIMDS